MKKHLDLLVYVSVVLFFVIGLATMNGCGSDTTGGGAPYDVSGALYGGTEEGKAIVVYATSEALLFTSSSGTVEAEMGSNSYHITGLPSGTYYVAALSDSLW
ncbi:MAG: hypothetical protein NT030_01230 [Candidatus Saganbacteria bacterium]|nr:hypothetical protein [Candidatus Saganbacteria bacterium]